MVTEKCIFCDIVSRKQPATFIQETTTSIVIPDIYPQAPVHYLIIPKKHISDIQSLSVTDKDLAGDLIMIAQSLANDLLQRAAFKLIVNSGAAAGQHIFHLHIHFLSGGRINTI